jgi:hypothetical protein
MILMVRDARERDAERGFASESFTEGIRGDFLLRRITDGAITVAEQLLVIAE